MSEPRMLVPEEGDSVFLEGDVLKIVDQTLIPEREAVIELTNPADVAEAIRRLAVRGAMAIGVAGAYGVLLGALEAEGGDLKMVRSSAREAARVIASSRPTARNLFWAVERMEEVLDDVGADTPESLIERLRVRADDIALDTIEANRRLVEAGQEVVGEGARALTHCNSGPMAALRYGTALGVLIEAHRRGKGIHVYVDETRPLLQGARITTWELGREGVPYTLIPDSAAATLMRNGFVDIVITGADRIAVNGDTANKIGTYALAVLAGKHGVPFYIAAPESTVDRRCSTGEDIVIEERDGDEVRMCGGRFIAPPDAPVFNPAFDVTPAELIDGIITERGILRPGCEL